MVPIATNESPTLKEKTLSLTSSSNMMSLFHTELKYSLILSKEITGIPLHRGIDICKAKMSSLSLCWLTPENQNSTGSVNQNQCFAN